MSERAALAPWRDALRDSKLDVKAKCVGFVLSTYFTGEGFTGHDALHPAPSKETIAHGASIGKRTADAAIERLARAGFLKVERSPGRRTNKYVASLPTVHQFAGLNGADESTVEESNRAANDAQPCSSGPPTVQPAAPESVESELRLLQPSVESLNDKDFEAWVASHEPSLYATTVIEAARLRRRAS
jgi:hypothetical protein